MKDSGYKRNWWDIIAEEDRIAWRHDKHGCKLGLQLRGSGLEIYGQSSIAAFLKISTEEYIERITEAGGYTVNGIGYFKTIEEAEEIVDWIESAFVMRKLIGET